MGMVSDRDLEAARSLPDEFLKLTGPPPDRVIELVNSYWDAYGHQRRAELVQALLPVLVDMMNQGQCRMDVYRGLCEGIVAMWLKRQSNASEKAG
ncbi:MAG: hypothetical protein JSW71_21105 [Gemmatimonadota bacterium]|nr:MAG: hypothetical protein JSW71_21105 [Gemmatimonadota bacterium]